MKGDENESAVRSAAVLAEWARLLLGSLARAGVEHAVISPGSRSTPFTWAALETPGLTCHSVLDERAAAFFALGQARVTGRPSLLICTSGSAAAQYYPAVVEASMSAVPLIALTADRPFELQAAGASQCLDQAKLYGDFVRSFLELGHPDDSASALDGVVRMAAQAVAAALGPLAGPVHLNAKARKPLEPSGDSPLSETVRRRLARGPTRITAARARLNADDVSELASECQTAARGLIVCGPIASQFAGQARSLFDLARVTGYPLAVEATSQARFHAEVPERDGPCVVIGGFEALSTSGFVARSAPELVIVLGATPSSAELERFLARTDAPYAIVSAQGHHDPVGKARWLFHADPFTAATALVEALSGRISGELLAQRRKITSEWRRADESYFALVDQRLAGEQEGPLTEPFAVRAAALAVPRGGWLGLGNSLPVREVDAFVRPSARGISVWSQRGVSGIDGLVSGAIGAASVAGAPSITLVGDVTFLHDVSGLALAKELSTPLALVVIDNGGGRIFETLPVARLLVERPERAKFWLTPGSYDLRHAAALYEVPYHRAEHAAELAHALEAALATPGLTLIHAIVAGDSGRAALAELRQALGKRLSD